MRFKDKDKDKDDRLVRDREFIHAAVGGAPHHHGQLQCGERVRRRSPERRVTSFVLLHVLVVLF